LRVEKVCFYLTLWGWESHAAPQLVRVLDRLLSQISGRNKRASKSDFRFLMDPLHERFSLWRNLAS